MERKFLTDEEYDKCMMELGFIKDEEFDKFFMGDSAFLDNVPDNVNDVHDLITFNDKGYPTYMATVLNNYMYRGAKLVIGPGAIDEFGNKRLKGLYCTNYRELYSEKGNIRK